MVKEKFLKYRLTDLCNSYKAIATLTTFAIASKDFPQVKKQFFLLKEIFNRVLSLIKPIVKTEIYKNAKNLNVSELPDYLEPLKTIDAYCKILSLKYANYETSDFKEKLMLNKMSIDCNCMEDIPFIKIGRALFENGNYPEAMQICYHLKEISDTAPTYSLMGDIYRKQGNYGEAINAYLKYLELNENDEEGMETLQQLYEEALK